MTTTTNAIVSAVVIARANVAAAELSYVDAIANAAEHIDSGACSATRFAKMAGWNTTDRVALPWLGRVVLAAADRELPLRGIVALEADVTTMTKNGHTDRLREIVNRAQCAEDAPTIDELAAAIAEAAGRTRESDTTTTRARKAGKGGQSGSGLPGSSEPRSLDTMLAQTLELLARIDRVADTMTPEQAAQLAVIGAGVESIAAKALVRR